MESWLSGLRRTTGNRVWADTPPRVQIPNSPPFRFPSDSWESGFFILFVYAHFSSIEKAACGGGPSETERNMQSWWSLRSGVSVSDLYRKLLQSTGCGEKRDAIQSTTGMINSA